MFSTDLGVKLDYGFNRFSNNTNTLNFKVNYTRINLQLVYDASKKLHIPPKLGLIGHIGPGYSIIKPLDVYTSNKKSYLNLLAGIETHFKLSDTFSVYNDVSYIYGISSKFNPTSSGNGSFNGNIITISFGVSLSLSGCQYCD